MRRLGRLRKLGLAGLLGMACFFPDRAESATFIRGDVNRDERVNMTDPIYTLNFLFKNGKEPECMDAADLDDNGKVNINDLVYSLNHLFLGGAEPVKPYPNRGLDFSSDGLRCEGISDFDRVVEIKSIPFKAENESNTLYVMTGDFSSLEKSALSFNQCKNIVVDGIGNILKFGGGENSGVKFKGCEFSILRNFYFEEGKNSVGNSAIEFDGSKGAEVENSNIIIFGHDSGGIRVVDSLDVFISNCDFIGEGDSNDLINIRKSAHCAVLNNNFEGSGDWLAGTRVSFSKDVSIRGNEIEFFGEGTKGAVLEGCSGIELVYNRMKIIGSRGESAYFFNTENSNIFNNDIESSREYSDCAVFSSDSKMNKFNNNYLISKGAFSRGLYINKSNLESLNNYIESYGDLSCGVELSACSFSKFYGLEVRTSGENADGMRIRGDSDGNAFYDSNIDSNRGKDFLFSSSSEGETLFFNVFSDNGVVFERDSKAQLKKHYYFSCEVRDNDGNPIENANVSGVRENRSFFSKSSDADGKISREIIEASSENAEGILYLPCSFLIRHENYKPFSEFVERIEGNLERVYVILRK